MPAESFYTISNAEDSSYKIIKITLGRSENGFILYTGNYSTNTLFSFNLRVIGGSGIDSKKPNSLAFSVLSGITTGHKSIAYYDPEINKNIIELNYNGMMHYGKTTIFSLISGCYNIYDIANVAASEYDDVKHTNKVDGIYN